MHIISDRLFPPLSYKTFLMTPHLVWVFLLETFCFCVCVVFDKRKKYGVGKVCYNGLGKGNIYTYMGRKIKGGGGGKRWNEMDRL